MENNVIMTETEMWEDGKETAKIQNNGGHIKGQR